MKRRGVVSMVLMCACAAAVAATSATAGPPAPAPDPAPIPMLWLGVSLEGTDATFLRQVAAATSAVGGTEIDVISAKRSRATNMGVDNSNHLCGHAVDARALVRGAWLPLGTALRDVAAGYGLRSGDLPGFYKGKRDPYHVDDGWNLRHRCA